MAKIKAPMNREKRPIDKSKRSNRRCCNCAFWPGGCGKTCEKSRRVIDYYNCCKLFEWNPAGVYVSEEETGATEMEFTFENMDQLILLFECVSCAATSIDGSLGNRMPTAERRIREKRLVAVKDLKSQLAQTQISYDPTNRWLTLSQTFNSKDMSIIQYSVEDIISECRQDILDRVEDLELLATEPDKFAQAFEVELNGVLDAQKKISYNLTFYAEKYGKLTALLAQLNEKALEVGMTVPKTF